MSTQVPTLEQVRSCLGPWRADSDPEAALFLLTPVDVLVGVEAWKDGSGWSYRGFSTTGTSLEALRGLVLAGSEPEDEYLTVPDTLDDPAKVCKLTRSGSGWVLTGIKELYGGENLYWRTRPNNPGKQTRVAAAGIHSGTRPIAGQADMSSSGHFLTAVEPESSPVGQRAAALAAAAHTARLRTQWQVGALDLAEEPACVSGVREFSLTGTGEDDVKARLLVGPDFIQTLVA